MTKFCEILRDPIFIFGVFLKILIIVYSENSMIKGWYIPFIDQSLQTLTINPWETWLDKGGNKIAFPYGVGMLFTFYPCFLLSYITGADIYAFYFLTILLADFILLYFLTATIKIKIRWILFVYWLSPISLFATYWMGFNDIVPTLFLFAATIALEKRWFALSAILLALSISGKLSFIITAPIFLIYMFNNQVLRQYLHVFIVSFVLSCLMFWLPFIFSEGAITMWFKNPELNKVYALKIPYEDNVGVYLVPLMYFLLLYLIWGVRRMSLEIFRSLLGLTLLVLVLLTPSQTGWFIWALPYLIISQLQSNRIAIVLHSLLAVLLVVISIDTSTLLMAFSASDIAKNLALPILLSEEKLRALLFTLFSTIGAIIAIRIWRDDINKESYFLFNRKPYSIGIAGDSGSGKDTLSEAIIDLFGKHSTNNISGDNYHIWNRQGSMWKAITHLNPMANHLERFGNDVLNLINRRIVYAPRYDHDSGQFTQPIKIRSKDFLIASGLHALYIPSLRSAFDLKIFLNMDENLRKFYKIRRDLHNRGKSLEDTLGTIERRKPDSKRFIWPQKKHADIIFSLRPINKEATLNINEIEYIRSKLNVRIRSGTSEQSLYRILVGLYGFSVDLKVTEDGEWVDVEVDGHLTADDSERVVDLLYPNLKELFDLNPKWHSGNLGLMVLFVLAHINFSLEKATR